MGKRFVALVAVVGIAVLAAAGIYLYRHHSQPPSVEEKVTKAEAPAPQKPAEPKQAEPVPAQPVSVPSFDIVRIEPTGEGVMAGRAERGWTISIESDGAAIAETKADDDGAWTVVLDKPLAPGDHSLALRATSPNGTQALTAQAPQQVAVTEKEPTAAQPPKEQAQSPAAHEQPMTAEAAPETPKLERKAEVPQGVEGQPEPVVPDENAPPPARPKPPVRIGKLDYQDTGASSGKISISGVGDPNIRLFLFFDEQPLGQVTIGLDGTWAIDIDKKLGEGEHTIRADTYDQKTGMVAGRASVRLGRETASNEATASQSAAPAAESAPAPKAASAEPAAAETGQLPGQPQPVYPEGAAEAEPASPEASTSAANTEPPFLSWEPQPVVPPQEATPEVANAEPAPAEPAPAEPVQAAPAAPQPAQAKPEAQVTAQPPASPKPAVVFKSVDYQDIGADSGKVSLAGTGDPGAHIRLFLDETPVGEAIVADDGTWVFAAEKRLETGEHKFRADSTKGGAAVGSASIGLVRMEKPKARPKQEQAAAEPAPAPAPAAGAAPQASPELQVAGTEEAKPAASREKTVHHKHKPRVYTVRHGDTLWEIAEAYYGGGWHYRAIVRDNKRSIKNPHWIYPRQKFHIPRGK
jgi:LysM domain